MALGGGNSPAMRALEILEQWKGAPHHRLPGGASNKVWATLEQERQEVLEAVLQSLASGDPDCDGAAACLDLLRHVASFNRQETTVRVS